MPARLKFQSFKAKSMSCPLNLLMLNSTHNGENLRPFPKCCLPVMAWLTLSQSPFPISPLGLKPLFQFWPCDGLTRASMLSLLSERTTKIHRSPFSNSLSSYSDKDWRRLNWLKKILWRCFWIAVLTNISACTRPATEDSQLCWCIRYFRRDELVKVHVLVCSPDDPRMKSKWQRCYDGVAGLSIQPHEGKRASARHLGLPLFEGNVAVVTDALERARKRPHSQRVQDNLDFVVCRLRHRPSNRKKDDDSVTFVNSTVGSRKRGRENDERWQWKPTVQPMNLCCCSRICSNAKADNGFYTPHCY